MNNQAPWGGNPDNARIRRADSIRPVSGDSPKPCCPMVAAVRSVRRGRLRLAYRYTALSVRLIGARLR